MADSSAGSYAVISLSLLPAYLLAALPLPFWLQAARPEWLALAVIYWTIALPRRMGGLFALLAGLLLDALQGAVLGQNALSLLCLTSIVQLLYQRLRLFTQLQQTVIVFCLISLHLLIGQWLRNWVLVAPPGDSFLLPALASAILWPLVFFSLRTVRRQFSVR